MTMIDEDAIAESTTPTLLYISALTLALITWILWKFVLFPVPLPPRPGGERRDDDRDVVVVVVVE